MFLAALLRFLKSLFELIYLFGQMAYLIGIPASWFLPGFLRGIEGLSQPVLLAAVLVEPTTLRGVVSRVWPVNSLAPFALSVRPFLGAPLSGPPPVRFPFLGTRSSAFVAAATFALLARAALFAFSTNNFSIFSRSTRMALGDSGTNACVSRI